MDKSRLADLQSSVINLRKEFKLIKEYLFKCYLKPEQTLIALEAAKEYFAAFVTPKSIRKELKKDDNDMVNLAHLLEVLEKGFIYIEGHEHMYTRWVPRSQTGM